MDAKSFYSKKKVVVLARSIPNAEVSEESDLFSDSAESDFALESDHESKTVEELHVLESDSETEQPVTLPPTAPEPAKKQKNDPLRQRTVPKDNIDLN